MLSRRMFKNLSEQSESTKCWKRCRVLVDRFQDACDRKVILELNCHLLVGERLKDREYELNKNKFEISPKILSL